MTSLERFQSGSSLNFERRIWRKDRSGGGKGNVKGHGVRRRRRPALPKTQRGDKGQTRTQIASLQPRVFLGPQVPHPRMPHSIRPRPGLSERLVSGRSLGLLNVIHVQ